MPCTRAATATASTTTSCCSSRSRGSRPTSSGTRSTTSSPTATLWPPPWPPSARPPGARPSTPFRALFFPSRNPPRVEFEHRGAEFKIPGTENAFSRGGNFVGAGDEVVVHRVRFRPAAMSSPPAGARRRQYSPLQCVVAHLWRCITTARRLDGNAITVARVAVDGRTRLRHPPVPQEYIGNVVTWARPAATAKDLAETPLGHTAELVSRAWTAATSGLDAERLAPTADAKKMVLSPDVEVYSLLGFPFRDIDFGSGAPFFHMRGYVAEEGLVFLVPSLSGDGSVYAYVNLFRRDMDVFKDCCRLSTLSCVL
ncbi:hypothetical protein EJB05_55967, partial [Eragrostis curvula]